MAIDDTRSSSDNKVWGLFKRPFRQSGSSMSSNTTPSYSSGASRDHNPSSQLVEHSNPQSSKSVALVARSILPIRRRLKLDPANKLYFPYEPGKQVRSAIKIKNRSKSCVAFKCQTTAPKSCFMRPPGAVLTPGESIIATVFKFVEPPDNDEKPNYQKSKDKFKIISLKVNGPMEYVPELFEELKDQVAREQILRVVYLDPERPNPALEKLKRQLADADAEAAARKKPPEDAAPRIIGEGMVIDEWKERRERYLARQKVEEVDSL